MSVMPIDHTFEDSVADEERDLAMDPTQARSVRAEHQASVEAGASFGRYVVLERIGAGGMGVVYAAWDPQLDRKLALKLLEPTGREADTHGRARMLREAQTMARLEHPNVVTVHDVGNVGAQLFIAMEFVEGLTLRAWLREEQRHVEAILEVFRAAGRGLAAAHAAGLVHRDFKPDNVMVGADTRVRVLDFGLARRGDGVDEELDTDARVSTRSSGAHAGLGSATADSLGSLTRTGVVIGTPAYMSPEQFRCEALDARSDQFSFCVALWEALAGERPFRAERQAELLIALSEGRRQPFPPAAQRPAEVGSVPTRVIAALERGLASDPEGRWPDMASLLEQLEPPAPRRRTWLVPVALGLALGVGASAAALLREPEPVLAPAAPAPIDCSKVGVDRFVGVWDEDRAAALERTFVATDLAWAPASAARVVERLDGWTARWQSLARSSCEAHHLRHELSAELFDLRVACLDQRLAALASLVDLLTPDQASPELVEQAIGAALALDGVEQCEDPLRLRARAIEDPELAAAAAALDAALDRREQLQDLAMFEEALAAGEALLPQLEAVDRPAQWSRYYRLRALDFIYLDPERRAAALEPATQGVVMGWRSELAEDELFAVLVMTRVTLVNEQLDESERWLRLGEALGESVEDPRSRYELLKARGFLAGRRNQEQAAADAFAAALDLARASFGPESPEVAVELANYGQSLMRLAAKTPELAKEAIASQRESVRLMRALYPANHPIALSVQLNLAGMLLDVGLGDDARRELDRLEPILSASLDEGHGLREAYATLRERATSQG